jgi:DNA processing protein
MAELAGRAGTARAASSPVDARLIAAAAAQGAADAGTHGSTRGNATATGGSPPWNEEPGTVRVLDSLSLRAGRTVDDIARRAGMTAREVMGVLGSLEVNGLASRSSDGWRRRRGG